MSGMSGLDSLGGGGGSGFPSGSDSGSATSGGMFSFGGVNIGSKGPSTLVIVAAVVGAVLLAVLLTRRA